MRKVSRLGPSWASGIGLRRRIWASVSLERQIRARRWPRHARAQQQPRRSGGQMLHGPRSGGGAAQARHRGDVGPRPPDLHRQSAPPPCPVLQARVASPEVAVFRSGGGPCTPPASCRSGRGAARAVSSSPSDLALGGAARAREGPSESPTVARTTPTLAVAAPSAPWWLRHQIQPLAAPPASRRGRWSRPPPSRSPCASSPASAPAAACIRAGPPPLRSIPASASCCRIRSLVAG
ncbi:unnamed protein product [Urochloa humidicola]